MTVLGVLAGTAAVVWAAPASITNDPANDRFLPTSFNHDPGTVANYVHSGTNPHNVTATTQGPDGKALFSSATISSGSAPVNGTQFLAPGSYPFFCTVHGTIMSGTLVVGAGTPQARPTAALKVLDTKLSKVVKKAQLRVKVTTTGTGTATIAASLGKKKITNSAQVTGAVSTVIKLRLTSKGRTAIESKKKVKLSVGATVDYDFGAPATATAKLK